MLDAAKSWAAKQAELLRQDLFKLYGGLEDVKNQNIESANLRRDALMNSITTNLGKVENQYQDDARGAYVNKMQSGRQLQGLLNRMNLGSSGFGVGQEMGIESAYGQNLTGLQKSRDLQVGDLNLQGTNIGLEHDARIRDIEAEYLENKSSLDRYIDEQVRGVTERETDRYLDQRRWSASQAAAAKQSGPQTYKDQAIGQYITGVIGVPSADGKSITYTTPTGDKYILKTGVNPFTGTISAAIRASDGSVDKSLTFSNGYQPNYYGKKVDKKGNTVYNKLFKTNDMVPINGQTQNVWNNGAGKFVVWNGATNKYIEVIKKDGNWVIK